MPLKRLKKIAPRSSTYDFRKYVKRSIFDKITFPHIFLIWMGLIVLFGLAYYNFGNGETFLRDTQKSTSIDSITDSIYFSFITATTTGFGDITPHGMFKVLAILEVIMGLILLAVVTSKLVSIKQDVILTELYDISFQERLNRLRSSLLLFRQNVGGMINDMEAGKTKKKRIVEIDMHMISFQSTLQEISSLFTHTREIEFLKRIDPLNTEILFNSVLSCWEKLIDLYSAMGKSKVKWKSEDNVTSALYCLKMTENLLAQIKKTGSLSNHILADFEGHYKNINAHAKSELQKKDKHFAP